MILIKIRSIVQSECPNVLHFALYNFSTLHFANFAFCIVQFFNNPLYIYSAKDKESALSKELA